MPCLIFLPVLLLLKLKAIVRFFVFMLFEGKARHRSSRCFLVATLGEVSQRDGEGVHVCFFIFILCKGAARHPLKPRGSYFVLSDKVCKTLFGARSPKVLSVPLKQA